MGISIPDWPTKSLDLNLLIENLWSMMDHHIKFTLRPTNRKELQAAIPCPFLIDKENQ